MFDFVLFYMAYMAKWNKNCTFATKTNIITFIFYTNKGK